LVRTGRGHPERRAREEGHVWIDPLASGGLPPCDRRHRPSDRPSHFSGEHHDRNGALRSSTGADHRQWRQFRSDWYDNFGVDDQQEPTRRRPYSVGLDQDCSRADSLWVHDLQSDGFAVPGWISVHASTARAAESGPRSGRHRDVFLAGRHTRLPEVHPVAHSGAAIRNLEGNDDDRSGCCAGRAAGAGERCFPGGFFLRIPGSSRAGSEQKHSGCSMQRRLRSAPWQYTGARER
jgi:hypothetical protein